MRDIMIQTFFLTAVKPLSNALMLRKCRLWIYLNLDIDKSGLFQFPCAFRFQRGKLESYRIRSKSVGDYKPCYFLPKICE